MCNVCYSFVSLLLSRLHNTSGQFSDDTGIMEKCVLVKPDRYKAAHQQLKLDAMVGIYQEKGFRLFLKREKLQ